MIWPELGQRVLPSWRSPSSHHFDEFVYGVDRYLREGENVLAGFVINRSTPYGCIVVDGRRLEIVRGKRAGWHFALRDDVTEEYVCEYIQSRFIRGGRIVGDPSPVTIRGVAFHPRRWTFASERGLRFDVKVEDTRHSKPLVRVLANRTDARSEGVRDAEPFARRLANSFERVGAYGRDRLLLRGVRSSLRGSLRLWFTALRRKDRGSPPTEGTDIDIASPDVSSHPERLSFFQVTLTPKDLPHIASEVSLRLAFACWLLVERESMVLPAGGG